MTVRVPILSLWPRTGGAEPDYQPWGGGSWWEVYVCTGTEKKCLVVLKFLGVPRDGGRKTTGNGTVRLPGVGRCKGCLVVGQSKERRDALGV